ncbi:MAG: T9SS type A sorting domain-containing protein [Bacteroidia bacterium]
MKQIISVILLITALLSSQSILKAQYFEPKINENDPNLPHWVELMYADDPNVYEVDVAFENYYSGKPFKHDIYTRYYKRWRRFVTPYVEEDGHIHYPTLEERLANSTQNSHAISRSTGDWDYLGPKIHYNARYNDNSQGVPISRHSNVYSVDRCEANPNVMYCGTESGGVYKTVDKAQNWTYVTKGLTVEGVSAVGADPFNEDIALFSSANEIWRTTDGGETWSVMGDATFQNLNISVWQFHFHPENSQIVFAATNLGLYRSTDNGLNWTQIFNGECMSVEFKLDNPQVLYALRYNSSRQIAEFYKSTDGGASFTVRLNGWFSVPAEDEGRITARGGRIALTEANPDRVYVLLVGTSQTDAVLQLRGTIGVYSSANNGDNWTFPHNLIGMPYDQETHPNLMDFDGESSTYNQIYYNTAFACSHLDENRLLIGGLNLWRSEDGGASYLPVGGYIGGLPLMHVDLQEFRVHKTSETTEEFWFSSDGGLNFSTDWCESHIALNRGIGAVNFWGMDFAWNDDIIVGGRYHNGNGAFFDTYGPGSFLALGGGENATGYVNYSPERKTFFSDIGGRVIPLNQQDFVTNFSVAQFPNESYFDNNSSRIMFDWEYWNIAYMGAGNKLNMSTDGGSTFTELYSFGIEDNRVLWMEQSHANPSIFIVQVLENSITQLYKSIDGGISFNQLTLPQSRREVYFSLSYENENEFWIAYTAGSNGNKIYRTSDGGGNWENLSTSTLNGLNIKAIGHQAGTNSGIYIASRRGPVHYRNADMQDWVSVGTNVPSASYPLRVMPFYPKNKLRLGMWNIGVWEHDLEEPSSLIADFSSNFKAFTCPGDTLWFVNHSVCDSSATLQWTFDGGTPSTSSLKAPKVTYSNPGVYEISLIVTQGGVSDTIVKPAFISSLDAATYPIAEDFESGSFTEGWKLIDDGNDGVNWRINQGISAFGQGSNCLYFDNYYNNVEGKRDRMLTRPIEGIQAGQSVEVIFDVAYSRYASNYSDSLAVYISYDCGETLELIYYKGGTDLSTVPDFTSFWEPTDDEWRTDTSNVFSITSTGSDFVIVFENRGAWGQPIYLDNIQINVDGLVTSLQSVLSPSVELFPVPAEAILSVKTERFERDEFTYFMIDASGRVCESGARNGNSFQLNTSRLSSGFYLLQISDGKNVFRKSFIKK